MRARWWCALFLLAFLFGPFRCFGYKVRDARGTEFEFSSPPTAATIVPSATECVFAIGAEENLLAVSRFCRFPEGAKNKEKIGAYLDPDYEKIARIKPDVFIAPWSSDTRLEDGLRRIGVRCFFLNREGVENISSDLILLGELFDRKSEGMRESGRIEASIESARAKAAELKKNRSKRPRAIFMFGAMAAGKGSYVGDLMEIAGFENCASSVGRPWFVFPKELVISSGIEVILVESKGKEDFEHLSERFKKDPVWSSTPAVKSGKIFPVDSDSISIPSVRITEALSELSKILEKCGNSQKSRPKKDP